MRIALDTNRYTDFARGESTVVDLISHASQVILPFIVVGELRGGFLRGSRNEENQNKLNQFLASRRVDVFYADDHTTIHYASLYNQLRKQGTPMPSNDVWIAALVLQNAVALCSRDSHFDYLPQLPRI